MNNRDYFLGLLAMIACAVALAIGNLAGAYVLLGFVCILWCVTWAFTMRKPVVMADGKPLVSENTVAFLCDEKACVGCPKTFCQHTTDIRHAANFKDTGGGLYMEKG